MWQVICVEPRRNWLLVTLESQSGKDLAGSLGRQAVTAVALEHGYAGGLEMLTNPYFVDRAGRIKKDVSPFAPAEGERVRVEYRLYPGPRNQAGQPGMSVFLPETPHVPVTPPPQGQACDD